MNLKTYLLQGNASNLKNIDFFRKSFTDATKLCNNNALLIGGNHTVYFEVPDLIAFSSLSYHQYFLIKSPLNNATLPLKASNLLDMGILSIIYKGAGNLEFGNTVIQLAEENPDGFTKYDILIYKDENNEFNIQKL